MEFYVILQVTLLSSVFRMGAASAKFPLLGEFAFEIIEGDILVTAAERAAIDNENEDSRNGMVDVLTRWPNKTVVYHIEDNVFDAEQIRKLETAMRDISHHTCIKFRKKQSASEHSANIVDIPGFGCASGVGFKYNLTNQLINLANDCFEHGVIEHELLHTIGFTHMHNTHDRDNYITINWANIKPGGKRDFKKRSHLAVTDFGVPYDYGSVMHYSRTAFSKNGKDTIIPKQNVFIGQRIGLSPSDILKINKMYDCP